MRRRRSLIPWLFPAAFVPVLGANGALIYFALHTKPALVDAHPFEDGRTYNREIDAAAAQRALGWRARLTAPARAGVAGPVALDIRDRGGAPLSGLDVELWIGRPVGARPARRLHLAETAPGRYAAAVRLPLAGQWQFDIVARRGGDEFAFGQRIVVR
jgi:nitrogen fixation protein FixH